MKTNTIKHINNNDHKILIKAKNNIYVMDNAIQN